MNILLLCHKSPWPPKEGGPIAMYAMIRGLLMAGINVRVLALNTNKYSVDPNEIPSEFKNQTRISFVDIDLSVKPFKAFLNLFSNKSYHIQRFISDQFATALTDILKNEVFDVIQFESLFLTSYINLIRRYSSACLVLRAHNIEHLIWYRLAHETTLPLNKLYLHHLAKTLKSYEITMINELDGIAAITPNDEARFRNLGCKKFIRTIPFGISPTGALSRPDILPANSLFHIGSMNWKPNQEGIRWFLKECWPLIHVKYPDVKLELAGREMPRWMLNTVMTGVEIKGEVADAGQFMLENGLMVVPLFSGSGIRVKIIEAMALGKTVITTSVGAEGIRCTHGQNILIADTPDDFLESIISCYSNPEWTAQIGLNAKLFIAENHLLETVSDLTRQFYHQLIQSLKE